MISIILASSSTRRKELLERIGLKFKVEKSNYEENLDLRLHPHALAKKLSLGKAEDVARKHKNSIIIAADTIVVCNGKILGKPKDEREARRMLRLLSGNIHLVITGFTIIDTDVNKIITKSIETKVYFKKITDEEIDLYIKTKEPFDKAGGYAIQERGSIFIEKIEGDFFNAVGLPIYSLARELNKLEIKILE